jgi:enoyl-CoA hydratase
MATDSPDVHISRTGRVGRIVLTRDHALNALTLGMVETIKDALDDWATRDLRAVTIESTSQRAFCSGGDIRQVRQDVLDGNAGAAHQFFSTEYAVNLLLGSYPVPVVALIDGICMGGGLGLSAHGAFHVVTENALFAMPETQIGFFPDVGGSHFLPRLPGNVGRYLALTGARFGAADAMTIGMATHSCSREVLGTIPGLLAEHDGPIDSLLRELAPADLGPSPIAENRDSIAHCFAPGSLDGPDGIRERLAQDGSSWAEQALVLLDNASPASLAVTLDLLARGRELSLADCLEMELDAADRVITTPDFAEGVRAALVDKDRQPRWAS